MKPYWGSCKENQGISPRLAPSQGPFTISTTKVKLTELYEACGQQIKVNSRGEVVLALKSLGRACNYRTLCRGPRGKVVTSVPSLELGNYDLVAFNVHVLLEWVRQELNGLREFGINADGPSFELDVYLVNKDLVTKQRTTKTQV